MPSGKVKRNESDNPLFFPALSYVENLQSVKELEKKLKNAKQMTDIRKLQLLGMMTSTGEHEVVIGNTEISLGKRKKLIIKGRESLNNYLRKELSLQDFLTWDAYGFPGFKEDELLEWFDTHGIPDELRDAVKIVFTPQLVTRSKDNE